MTPSSTRPRWVIVLRWVARLGAAGVGLFWGLFLVEHLQEWVFRAGDLPPPFVLITLAAHTALIVGLVVGWRWELLGGTVALAAACLFLPGKARPDLAPLFMTVTAAPPALWLVVGGYELGRRSAAVPPDDAPTTSSGL